MNKYKNRKKNKAAIFPFSKLSSLSNHGISLDTKRPLNHASGGNHYIYLLVDLFNKNIVTVPTPKGNAQYAVKALFHNWMSKFGPSQNLITDRGKEYLKSDVAECCILFNFPHSPKVLNAPWTNEFVEE